MAGQTIKVDEHFWILDEGGVRSFLFEGTDKAMLVDTGFGNIPLKAMAEEVTSLPIFVVLTHADGDHTGANKDFDEIYMHPSEMDYYKYRLPEGCTMANVKPVWEGEVIDLGYWKFEVILTPGHTPGSIMLLERSKRMLISGDSVQTGEIFMFNQGRNIPAYIASLERLNKMTDAFDTIWPSHNECPIKPDIIPGLVKGIHEFVEGKLVEQDVPFDMPWVKGCKMYRCEAAAFLCDPGELDV